MKGLDNSLKGLSIGSYQSTNILLWHPFKCSYQKLLNESASKAINVIKVHYELFKGSIISAGCHSEYNEESHGSMY